MTEPTDKKRASRRGFLAGAAGMIAAGTTGAASANDKNLPPNIADWTKTLGDGVAVRPYGHPSKFEKGVIRRDVQWLTASRESSVSFTPLHELDVSSLRTASASSVITAASPKSLRKIPGC